MILSNRWMRGRSCESRFCRSESRYIAILDYDDVLYPEAYRLLRDRSFESGRAIAFGNIVLKRVDVYSGFLYAPARRAPFKGRQLTDLFRLNFCPIHSFLVDRKRVPGEELRFEPALTIEEDYEFLLRVCARVASDFALVDTEIGEYNFKNDSSNTYARDGKLSDATRARIEAAIAFNESCRRLTVISEEVQRQLGLRTYQHGLTIRAFLDQS